MAGSKSGRSTAPSRRPPQDDWVHAGAILWLPPKWVVDKNRVRVWTPKEDNGMEEAEPGAYGRPILVLSRPTASTIEFITLRSYNSTALENRWQHFREASEQGQEHLDIVKEHLSIRPAVHPLCTSEDGDTYRALRVCDGRQLSFPSHVSVKPILTMDWENAQCYFWKAEKYGPHDPVKRHWRLDDSSMQSVLKLAEQKAFYVPEAEYERV